MKRGGEEIYVGPLGRHHCHLIEYFEGFEGVPKIRDGQNPATWMLDVTSSAQELILGNDFAEVYKNSELYRDSKQDIYNAMGSMYASVFLLGQQSAISVQPLVAVEQTVSYRERAAGMYSALALAFGQVVIEIPYSLAQTVIYATIAYAMVGFEWTAKKFMWYMFFTFFSQLYFIYYGMLTVALTPNQQIASILNTSTYSLWNVFSGIVIPRPATPLWWRWYHWANPLAWSLYGLLASQFGDVRDELDTKQSVGDFLANHFGFEHDFVGVVAVVVAGFAIFFAIMFAFVVRTFNFQRR